MVKHKTTYIVSEGEACWHYDELYPYECLPIAQEETNLNERVKINEAKQWRDIGQIMASFEDGWYRKSAQQSTGDYHIFKADLITGPEVLNNEYGEYLTCKEGKIKLVEKIMTISHKDVIKLAHAIYN